MTQEIEYSSEDHLQKSCAWYCFGDLIQTELDYFREQWNSHYICRSRDIEVYGRPDSIYYFPKNGFSDQSLGVVPADIGTMKSYLNEINENDNDDQLLTEYSDYLSAEFRIGKQNTFEKARAVFEVFLWLMRWSDFPVCDLAT